MTSTLSTRGRIAILLAIAVAETFVLIHFYEKASFVSFAIVSVGAILTLLPFFWFDWLRKRGSSGHLYPGTAACFCATAAALAARTFWIRGSRQIAMGDGILALSILATYFAKLMWPKRDLLTAYLLSLLIYVGFAVTQWPASGDDQSTRLFSIPTVALKVLLPIPAVILATLVTTAFIRKGKSVKTNHSVPATGEDGNGGRG